MSQPRLPCAKVAFLVFCVRLLLAISTTGFFQPDEYFQALEPAHRAVFGYGHLTWEWTADPPIRSFIYPSLFIPAYALIKHLHLENTLFLVWAPKLVQVVFAALGDIALYYLTSSFLSEDHAVASLLLSLVSPFNTLALTRTLSNSTETSLTTMALGFWPFLGFRSRLRTRTALGLAGLSCMIRPTGVIIWIFLGLELAWRWRSSTVRVGGLILDVALVGIASFAILVGIDTAYYGALTFTPISFLKTNVFSGTACFYGVNAFHYYLTQGLPIILGPCLPFALYGIWMHLTSPIDKSVQVRSARTHQGFSILLGLVVWTVTIYSCLAHKEWRFIHPLLPILHIFAAKSLVDFWNKNKVKHAKSASTSSLQRPPILRHHLSILLGISLPLNVYLVRMHGSAQITATRYLHSLGQDASRVKSVGVLMPCHSIPWQSYIHLPHLEQADAGSRLWALGCEPPLGLNGTRLQSYTSQTDVFFETAGPIDYFQRYFPKVVDSAFPPSPAPFTIPGNLPPENGWNHTWPSHLVMFGALENQSSLSKPSVTVKSKLEELGYEVVRRVENGWEEDERRKGGVIIWEWTDRVL